MDRTIIGTWKAEEKELSEKLYKNLQGLALVFPASDDFRKNCTTDMFLKPNQTAFVHVMHFLLQFDPAEFKKRFYWPITDKRSESIFRSSCVEYLQYLNDKHQLQWVNIKSFIVVKPGGMKFINFMLEFVEFIIRELTRQREKELGLEVLPALNLNEMRRQNEFLNEYATAYISDIDAQRDMLYEKSEVLRSKMQHLADEAGLALEQITNDTFLKEFEIRNQKLFEKKYSNRVNTIGMLESSLFELKDIVTNFESKETALKYDKDAVNQSLQIIDQRNHVETQKANGTAVNAVRDQEFQINSLIEAFNKIHHDIETSLDKTNKQPIMEEFLCKELNDVKSNFQQIETQITDFQKKLNTNIKNHLSAERTVVMSTPSGICGNNFTTESTLLSKFVSTPPINIELTETGRCTLTRLPLLDAMGAKSTNSFTNCLALPPSEQRSKHLEHSFDLNNTFNHSRIIDPMQLLRTINKKNVKPTPQQNLLATRPKWKERQCIFGSAIDSMATPVRSSDNTANTETLQATILFNTSEVTRIARCGQINDFNPISLPRKLSAVKKVQDASLHLHNLSTSPSGRLDPLVTPEIKVQLNDVTLSEQPLNQDTSNPIIDCLNNSNLDLLKDDGNNRNFFNLPKDIDNDDIFNISDGVLKDVSM